MKMSVLRIAFFIIFFIQVVPASGFAPSEIVVVYNEAQTIVNASKGVALYYAQSRGIPQSNVIGIITFVNKQVSGSQYVDYIATPIWNTLSQPAYSNIKVIVLCYGIPYKIWTSDTGAKGSVDSALMLLGNPNVLNVTHWGLQSNNPYYNSSVDWDTFRDSAANIINSGGLGWKLNYLVTRLDGFNEPKTTVTIGNESYSIPSDVKNMIDRAVRADNAGRAGLSDAIAVLDDGDYEQRCFSSDTETALNSLLGDITGNPINAWRVAGETNNIYAVGKQNVIAYASNGSYDESADQVVTWWRPYNKWKDGAVALYWKVSNDGALIRTPELITQTPVI